jgi:DNA-binding transcriptional regulator GbsR (MarR family)
VAQVHALLYVSEQPLSAETIADTLEVARSNVSVSLRELQAWGLVRIVHQMGDRRDHFHTTHDVWEMFQIILEGRKRREIDPTLLVLRELMAESSTAGLGAHAQARLGEMLAVLRDDHRLVRAGAQDAEEHLDALHQDGRPRGAPAGERMSSARDASPGLALAGGLLIGVAIVHAVFGAWFGRLPLGAMFSDGLVASVDLRGERGLGLLLPAAESAADDDRAAVRVPGASAASRRRAGSASRCCC